MLKVDQVDLYYGPIQALKQVSFEVKPGEIVSLIGANGAGKTTCLSAISGLHRIQAGHIYFAGQEISHTPAHKLVTAGLAQVPEGRRVFLQMTVLENLELGAYTRKKSQLQAKLDKVFALFPRLEERQKQTAGTLSGGEQQMLALGRALMSQPRLLLLDEPSMGLAPLIVEQIFDIILQLHDLGTTILLVEQNAHMALSIADRAYVMETGKITLSGSASQLLADDQVRKAYLGE
ncbi:MAG: ABC transporter ATP-binding protein [Eubacteriales bacterium]|nr:ABC transporter ATP-binding protein [Eubacteriales bacterium]